MAAGCGLFISEEALNIWVCPLFWYFCFTSSRNCRVRFSEICVFHGSIVVPEFIFLENDLGWGISSKDAVFGWDMAVSC